MDLNHPVIQSLVLPLALALVLAALLRGIPGIRRGGLVATLAIGVAWLVSYGVIFGPPVWPAQAGLQKLPLIVSLGLAGGLALDIVRPGRLASGAVAVTALALTSLWLGWPQLEGGDAGVLPLLVLCSLAGLASLTGLLRAPPEGANRPAMILVAALTLAGAGFNGGSLALFQVALALAAAVGGFALWNWPRPRLPFAAGGIAVGGLGCFVLALLLLLLTQIRPWMLLPLPLIFVSDAVARRLPVPGGLKRTAVEPLYIAALSALPALATLLLAQLPAVSDDLYYR